MSMNLISRGPPRTCVFRVSESSGVWEVTKNAAFYGDYMNRDQAVRGACYGARAVEATGGSAQVVVQPGDKPVDHRTLA